MESKIIAYTILFVLLSTIAFAEKYFVLDVNHVFDSVSFNSINLREINRVIGYTDKSGYLIKTISFENSNINVFYYNMSENKNYIIYIPYQENAARIEVYNTKDSKIMDIDISSFANTCGNNICEAHESYESCTKDCSSGSKDDFCDSVKDGVCDPDCSLKADVDCQGIESGDLNESVSITEIQQPQTIEVPKKPNYLVWILLVLVIIVLILLFLFLKKRKEGQIVNSLRQYVNENIRRGFTIQQIKDVLYREGYTEKEVDKAIKPI